MINYYLITKPGIVLGNLVTLAAGFLLASKGFFHLSLFLAVLLGLAFIMASACIFNNFIDRHLDKKMQRTKHRAFASGSISENYALALATLLGLTGHICLLLYTNILTVFIAALGYFIYVVLYSLWKSRTIYGTAIGSLAGAVPPVVGYCAVTNQLDLGAIIFFTMLVLWQMPHFFSIALRNINDYKAAQIPVMPVIKGVYRTKIQMLIYIPIFIIAASTLTLVGYTGKVYLLVTLMMGCAWLMLSIKGLIMHQDDHKWSQQMFIFSLITITSICLIIPLDVI